MKKFAVFGSLALTVLAAVKAYAQESYAQTEDVIVPIRAVTHGPKAHWFAYYDKLQFDSTNQRLLGMETDFEGRKPTPDDVIRLGVIDLANGDTWTQIGESRSWCWQQGCMLQWLPGSDSKVIYNDREGDHYVAIIKDLNTGESRTLPRAVYCVSPDGKIGLSIPFARLDDTRPGYGYKGVVDPWADDPHPAEDGIYSVNLETGESKLIISLDRTAAIATGANPDTKHWFNHLLFNTDGTRFSFLERAFLKTTDRNGRSTSLFTANPDGSDLYCLNDHGMVSHYIWKTPAILMGWSKEPADGAKFHIYTDKTENVETVGADVLKVDGHCTYSPDGNWILTDTYPDAKRMIMLMLYRPADGKLIKFGRFFHPQVSDLEFRCDLHPRWSRDGRCVSIDSLHAGQRQIYVLDVGEIMQKG
ncbi:MAG: hypothetical protein K1Y02_09800 [Candidatus Hydrogenedentes bacterium]|nr:hypothetical protein [Candidatus Hydrogenedentota bacterium]